MADANGPLEVRPIEGCHKVDQFPDTPADFDPAVVQNGKASRVIPAIVKPPQPVQQQRDGVLAPDISDYAAHEDSQLFRLACYY
jgi:hypothetical protein